MDRSAIRHHLDRALDHASILVALAQHRLSEADPIHQLRARQHLQLDDHLHLFSFHARKAIELAALIKSASELPLAHPHETLPPEIVGLGIASHTTQDLWWVLNRIVHSRLLSVVEAEGVDTVAEWTTDLTKSYWTPSLFLVRSDRDSDEAQHWVEVYHLVRAFLTLEQDIARVAQEST